MLYSFKKSFDKYYQSVYLRWRILKEKAGKDIVGEEYEKLRKEFYQSFGLIVNKLQNVYGSGVNPDNVITKNGKIIIIEEDKGSYVDGTFLKRVIVDAATIFSTCLEKNIKCPYFILSSTTKMNNYDETFDKIINLFNENLKKELKEKCIYLPLCTNGRVSQKKYFKTKENHFQLSEELLEVQTKTINKIINKINE